MRDKVDEVFKSVLHIDPQGGQAKLVYNETEGWDSVGHMALVAGLEDAFNCMLDVDDILAMSSYDEVVTIMGRHARAD